MKKINFTFLLEHSHSTIEFDFLDQLSEIA